MKPEVKKLLPGRCIMLIWMRCHHTSEICLSSLSLKRMCLGRLFLLPLGKYTHLSEHHSVF